MKIIKWLPLKNKILKLELGILNLISTKIKFYLNWIRKLNKNDYEIDSGNWDAHIMLKISNEKTLVKVDSSFYTDKEVWKEYYLDLESYFNKSIDFDPLSYYTTLYLRTLLRLFWRDIINKLNSNTMIKFQLRVQLKLNDKSEKILIRSLGKVQIVSKNDY